MQQTMDSRGATQTVQPAEEASSGQGANVGDITVSAAAAERIKALAEAEGDSNLMLRVSVAGGGCSGFQYGFDFDSQINDEDRVFERDGARVVIDDISLQLLTGSEIDYVEALIGSYFQINNPNASSSCGCGVSFSI